MHIKRNRTSDRFSKKRCLTAVRSFIDSPVRRFVHFSLAILLIAYGLAPQPGLAASEAASGDAAVKTQVAGATAKATADDKNKDDGSGSDNDQGEEKPEEKPTVQDVGILLQGTDTALGHASKSSDNPSASIDEKGGVLNLDSKLYWSDGSYDINDSKVKWASSKESVAAINQNGRVSAKDDGKTTITATVDAKYADGDKDLVAKAVIEVTGQTDARYVTKVEILSSDGKTIGSKTHVLEKDLSTSKEQLYARVTVFDPAKGTSKTYNTKNGSLSSQDSALSDPVWSVGDTAMATIDESLGMFRPRVYGMIRVSATSNAGKNGKAVSQTVTIQAKDPDGGKVIEGNFPQEKLTIKAYYETQKPSDMNGDDEKFVINKTYSTTDMERLGTVTKTYTALGSGSYFTMTGTGVPLSNLLKDAGVNIKGVKTLAFGTQDNIDRTVSYNYIFGCDRFYYPNIDCGSYAEAEQVYPIMALESNEVKNAETKPNYDMSEGTRFRLLFGSTPDGGTSQYQIKWIHTLYVILKGGPSVKPDGDDPGDGPGKDDDGSGKGKDDSKKDEGGTKPKPSKQEDAKSKPEKKEKKSGSGEDGSGSGAGTSGKGTGKGDGSGSADGTSNGNGNANDKNGGSANNSGSAGGFDGSQQGSEGSEGDNSDGTDETGEQKARPKAKGAARGSSGSYSVYQVMNANDSKTEKTVEYTNPFKGVAAPIGFAMLAIGGIESLVWYRRQRRPVRLS